jgi:hypothetical protein
MRSMLIVSAATIVLAGCSKKEEYSTAEMALSEAPAAAGAPAADAATPTAPRTPGEAPAPTVPTPSPALIAYEYSYTLGAPQAQVRGLIARHEAACRSAGAAVCQVTGSRMNAEGERRLEASLVLRATPEWVARFRGSLAADVAKSDGRIVNSAVESEDLSRTIIDTGARVRALTALRDRLQALIASRPGKLGELLEIERELARVQGEIDAAQSHLVHSQGRVATSVLTLNYESRDALEGRGLWAPIGDALGDFLELIVGVVAFLIRFLAVVLPLAVVVGAGLWLARGPLRRAMAERRRARAREEGRKTADGALTDEPPPV